MKGGLRGGLNGGLKGGNLKRGLSGEGLIAETAAGRCVVRN